VAVAGDEASHMKHDITIYILIEQARLRPESNERC